MNQSSFLFSNTLMNLVSLYACCNLESKTRLPSGAQTVAFYSGHSACETSNICLSFENRKLLCLLSILFFGKTHNKLDEIFLFKKCPNFMKLKNCELTFSKNRLNLHNISNFYMNFLSENVLFLKILPKAP